MKKLSAVIALAMTTVMMLSACGNTAKTEAPKTEAAKTEAAKSEAKAEGGIKEGDYIAVVSKGKQHQFWQAVESGAKKAADEHKIRITFEGPATESMIEEQVKMLNSAMDQKPKAIALAALDTNSVMDQLQKCVDMKIPVIGFDSGVPNAPKGAIFATVATNNEAAGGIGATEIMKVIGDKVKAATADKPVIIGCVSQDQTSASVLGRTKGFVDKMVELLKGAGLAEADFAVIGSDKFKVGKEEGAKVLVQVAIGQTSNDADVTTAAKTILDKDNVLAIFGSNEQAAKMILQATSEGADLTKRGIVAVGFDAGERQKAAVKAGVFLGSITQDPVNIGYKSVDLAFKAAKGEAVADVDTGAKFYTKDNMDQAEMKPLLYD